MKIPEIIRLNYITGNYSMFIEVVCKDITQLRFVLHDELQKIKGIERTETFISLEEGFNGYCRLHLQINQVFTSAASRKPLPRILKDKTISIIASPGMMASSAWSVMMKW